MTTNPNKKKCRKCGSVTDGSVSVQIKGMILNFCSLAHAAEYLNGVQMLPEESRPTAWRPGPAETKGK